jgi:hypothetical protein
MALAENGKALSPSKGLEECVPHCRQKKLDGYRVQGIIGCAEQEGCRLLVDFNYSNEVVAGAVGHLRTKSPKLEIVANVFGRQNLSANTSG